MQNKTNKKSVRKINKKFKFKPNFPFPTPITSATLGLNNSLTLTRIRTSNLFSYRKLSFIDQLQQFGAREVASDDIIEDVRQGNEDDGYFGRKLLKNMDDRFSKVGLSRIKYSQNQKLINELGIFANRSCNIRTAIRMEALQPCWTIRGKLILTPAELKAYYNVFLTSKSRMWWLPRFQSMLDVIETRRDRKVFFIKHMLEFSLERSKNNLFDNKLSVNDFRKFYTRLRT